MAANISPQPSAFPQLSAAEYEQITASLGEMYRFERILSKKRISVSVVVRKALPDSASLGPLYLMRLFTKPWPSSALSSKLNLVSDLYFERLAKYPFVVKPVQIRESDRFIVMLRPYARSNLPDFLSTRPASFQEKLSIAGQIISMLNHLHGVKVYHGDLTPNKILCGTFGQLFISDITLVKPFCPDSSTQTFDFISTWFGSNLEYSVDSDTFGRGCYFAPERLQSNCKENWQAADLFSLGCILAELLSVNLLALLNHQDLVQLSKADDDEKFNEMLLSRLRTIQVPRDQIATIMQLCCRSPEERKLPSWGNRIVRPDYFAGTNSERIDQLSAFSAQLLDSTRLTLLLGSFLGETDFSVKCHLFDLFLKEVSRSNLPQSRVAELTERLTEMIKSLEDGECFNELLSAAFGAPWEDKAYCESFLRSLPAIDDLKSVISDSRKMPTQVAFEIMYKTVQLYKSRRVVDPEFELLTADFFLSLMQRPDFNTESLITQSIEFVEDFVAPLCEAGRLPATIIDEYIRINDMEASKSKASTLLPLDRRKFDFFLDLEKYQIPLEGVDTDKVSVYRPLRQKKRLEVELKQPVTGSISISGSIFATWTESNIQLWNLETMGKGPLFDCEFDFKIIDACAFKERLWIVNDARQLLELEASDAWSKIMQVKVIKDLAALGEKPRLLPAAEGIVAYSPASHLISLIKPTMSMDLVLDSFPRKVCILDKYSILVCLMDGSLRIIDTSIESKMTVLYSWVLDELAWVVSGADACSNSTNTLVALATTREDASVTAIWLYKIKSGQESILEPIFKIIMSGKNGDLGTTNDLRLLTGTGAGIDCRHLRAIDSTLMLRTEELIFLGADGILRLFDFCNLSSENRSSVLLPDAYRPLLKLRNKQGNVAEIEERGNVHECLPFISANAFLLEGEEMELVYVAGRKIIAIS